MNKSNLKKFAEGYNRYIAEENHGRNPFRAGSYAADGHDAARREILRSQLDGSGRNLDRTDLTPITAETANDAIRQMLDTDQFFMKKSGIPFVVNQQYIDYINNL